MRDNDNFWIGLMIGVTVPVLGYFVVENIFHLLSEQGIMDEISASTGQKRLRTVALIAICTNIIPSQYLAKQRYNNMLKACISVTLVYAGFWIYHFHSGLFL